MAGNNHTHPRIDYLMEKETSTILGVLDTDESITYIASERRASGAWLSPSVIMLTSRRIIIMNRLAAGMKSDIAFIPFDRVLTVRVSHGLMFSSLHIKLSGEGESAGIFNGRRREGEIHGLDREEAEYLLHNILAEMKAQTGQQDGGKHYHLHGSVINNTYVNGPRRQPQQQGRQGEESEKEPAKAIEYKNLADSMLLFRLRKQASEEEGDEYASAVAEE